jgi:hypothetical protein
MGGTAKKFDDQGIAITRVSTTVLKDKKRIDVPVIANKAIPIIFLPGVLGSPLMAMGENGKVMGEDNKWAWYPDYIATWMVGLPVFWRDGFAFLSASDRKKLLNPNETYAFSPYEQEIGRSLLKRIKKALRTHFLYFFPTSEPLFSIQEALRRGWGTVGWNTAYCDVLPYLERTLRYLTYAQSAQDTQQVKEVRKMLEQVNEYFPAAALDTGVLNQYLETSKAYHYPVFAIGYNWLQSNGDSADYAFQRVQDIIEYVKAPRRSQADSGEIDDLPKAADGFGLGLSCEDGIILVTHSMGGLVARSLSKKHGAELAAMNAPIRGIVHGVQPCNGSGTLYYRLRAGWEGFGGKVIANTGPLLAPLLGGAPGGMELAPNQYYGFGWLRVHDKTTGELVFSLPKQTGGSCDPYGDIYLEKDAWWRLTEPELIAPDAPNGENREQVLQDSWDKYERVVETAQNFHEGLDGYFHPNSYVHYGGSPEVHSWANVHWELTPWTSSSEPVGNAQNEEVLTATTIEDTDNPYRRRGGTTWLRTAQGHSFYAELPKGQDSGDGVVPYNSGNPWFSYAGPAQKPANMASDAHATRQGAVYATEYQWVRAVGRAPDPVQFIFEFYKQDFAHSDSYMKDQVLQVTAFSILNVVASEQHPMHAPKAESDGNPPVADEEPVNG